MQTSLQITFHGLGPSTAIEEYVRRRAAKLETFFDRIIACHVTVEVPNHRHRLGRHYRVRVDVRVPKAELVVGRAPDPSRSYEDAYAAIDNAFDDAGRELQDYVRKLRGETKPHAHQRRGRVSKLFAYEGYGFIESSDGEEVYFHRNSVRQGAFARMRVGSEVRFVDEPGDSGPQASTVTVRKSRALRKSPSAARVRRQAS